ncbi:hypothetical protein BKH45_00905 [Helicobacter sp. 11S03491-1]|nr:hypothetical protein BKH45_00900 [Helicobacter sp. 11S03491-1]PAF43927.1 hypothetical protein BKH45_00905 [Helicobacter sp. 11S03491-1]
MGFGSEKKPQDKNILIKNAVVFDGYNQLKGLQDILIKNNKITQVAPGIKAPSDAQIIDIKGKFLMPGLLDAHWHTMLAAAPMSAYNLPDDGLLVAAAVKEAKKTVLRGFTTIRDMAGGVFGIKKAIDEKIISGPRIFPSGAFISQTAGHGDMKPITDAPTFYGGTQVPMEQRGDFVIADGVSEVLTAVRWQLKKGASQIKIGAGGGVISEFDPMDSLQFSPEEMKAAVQAASSWGTYVCAHVYSDVGINRAVDAGILSIEHGQLAGEKTIKKMADKGVWLSTQAMETNQYWPKPLSPKGAILDRKWRKVLQYAIKNKCNYAFGTDFLFSPHAASGQNYSLYLFSEVLGALDALRMATSGNAKLLGMSGERNPYIDGKIGVIQPGAWADLIVVDGNVLQDFKLIYEYEDKFHLIIKDGDVVKNILA